MAKPNSDAIKKAEDEVKTAAKKTVKKASEKAEVVAEKATEVVKKATIKKATSIFVQYGEKELNTNDLVEKAKADFVANGHKKSEAKDIKIYVKPEENMVYYVINDEVSGGFEA